jgi:hypothetical protein
MGVATLCWPQFQGRILYENVTASVEAELFSFFYLQKQFSGGIVKARNAVSLLPVPHASQSLQESIFLRHTGKTGAAGGAAKGANSSQAKKVR